MFCYIDNACPQVFQSIAKDVMVRLRDSQSESPSLGSGTGGVQLGGNAAAGKGKGTRDAADAGSCFCTGPKHHLDLTAAAQLCTRGYSLSTSQWVKL